ncbi:MAG: hypothetical protein RLZZ546_2136 [Bacteroidota bacterium]
MYIFKFFGFFLLVVLYSCNRNIEKPIKFQPAEDLFLAKQYPDFTPNYIGIQTALEQIKRENDRGKRTDGLWQQQGPNNIGARITTIAMHPLDENIIYIGYADGGVWKTVDGGKNWQPIFDGEINLSIGSIAIDPIDGNTIYVGTGDPAITGYPRAGGGLYKSTNGGNTWKYLNLKETSIITRIHVEKSNPNLVYVSSMGKPFVKSKDKGLYKSTDGGNTFQQVLFVNDSAGISEFVVHPNNSNIIYAVAWNRVRNNKKSLVSGDDARVYRTKNGGQSWEILTNGLPLQPFTRMGICISEKNPNVLYVQYTNPNDGTDDAFNFNSIYRTNDGGDSWELHTAANTKELSSRIMGGFGWYFGKIRVNPNDENDLILLAVNIYRYNEDSDTWSIIDYGNGVVPHADKHDLIFRNNYMYLATDGGLYKANVEGDIFWEDIENIPTTQFYRTAYNPHLPDEYYGGAQDNGTCKGSSAAPNQWQEIFGGDGFQMVFRPDNPLVYYVEYQRGEIFVTENGGVDYTSATSGLQGSRHWDMQYILSNHDYDVLYAGTNKMYKSTSGIIPSWEAISDELVDINKPAIIHQITTLAESPLSPMVLYSGSSDGLVFNTKDGGQNWINITGGLPDRYVSSIKASPTFANAVFVTHTGYKDNENTPLIHHSIDNGMTWKSIAGNLPQIAINDVFIYPNGQDNIIFVATDGGIFITKNRGEFWERLGKNMPIIPVFDMDLNIANNQLIASTFARGIQTFDLEQIGVDFDTNTDEISKESNPFVFPNISVDKIELKNISKNDFIVDIKGSVIFSSLKEGVLDISHLPAGIYYLVTQHTTYPFTKI